MNGQLKGLLAAGLLLFSAAAEAGVIGQWTGSGRSWNNSQFTTISNTLTSAGHVIEADGAITAANLANDDMFVIAEATTGLSASATSALASWVTSGGILWMAVDSPSNVAISNGILSGIGSSMDFLGSNTGNGSPLAAGNFATNNIFDIVGQNLTLSLGKEVVTGGGLALSGDILSVEQIGAGWVFAAGDRFEHNFSNSTASSVNGQLLLNVAGFASTPVPAPAGVLLLGLALLFAGRARR